MINTIHQDQSKNMVDYSNVLHIGGAIIIEIALGYIAGKFHFFKPEATNALNRFLLKCCFLPMIARQIAVKNLSTLSFMPFGVSVLTIFTSTIIIGVICFFLKCFNERYYMFLSTYLPSNYINYQIIGLPVFNSIWGEEENIVAAVQNMSNDLCIVPLYLIFTRIYHVKLENKLHKEANDGLIEKVDWHLPVDIILRIITNNFIIGNVLGFIYAATKWKMCPYLWDLMKYLADSVLALCMFAVGSFLSEYSLIACNFFHLLICLLIRHIFFPLIAAFYCFLFKLKHRLCRQITILAALPSANASFLLSNLNKTGAGVSSSMILWSTFLSVPFIILWLYVFDKFHIFE